MLLILYLYNDQENQLGDFYDKMIQLKQEKCDLFHQVSSLIVHMMRKTMLLDDSDQGEIKRLERDVAEGKAQNEST